jgi:hypothetical protein
MKKAALATGLMVLLFISTKAQNIDYIGSTLWTGVMDAKVVGNYAYCALIDGLVILDVSNPSQPVFISKLYCNGQGKEVFISDNYAYLADGSGGVAIIDITDPHAPALHNRYYTTTAYGIYVSGAYAYVADGDNGLTIISSNPDNPYYIWEYQTTGVSQKVIIRDNYAFLSDQQRMAIIDISDPGNPVEVGAFLTMAESVALRGDTAFVACGGYGLSIVDITNMAHPVMIGNYPMPPWSTYGQDVELLGDYAYLADRGDLLAINISNPMNPVVTGTYHCAAWSTFIVGTYCYVADYPNALDIINISDPLNPILSGQYIAEGGSEKIAVSGNYAYVGGEILDISDPQNPFIAARNNDPNTDFQGMSIQGNYLYVTGSNGAMIIYDISNPLNIYMAGFYFYRDMVTLYAAISGPYAYVAGGNNFMVVDITDPTAPVLVDSLNTVEDVHCIAVSGDYAYVGSDLNGLAIINIADPANPELVSIFNDNNAIGNILSLAVSGDYVYIGSSNWSTNLIDILNISDPLNPVIASRITAPDYPEDIVVSNGFAYFCALGSGPGIFDITDPYHPVLIASYDTPGNTWDLALQGEYIYLADGCSTMILRCSETQVGDIAGIVTDSLSNPIYNALVSTSFGLAYCRTDSMGKYLLTHLTPGNYDIQFSKVGYSDTTIGNVAVSTGETTLVNMSMRSLSGCPYLPGDINGNEQANGLDVVYGVNYFKGGTVPLIDCGSYCPDLSPFYAAGDVNASCTFNGIDITYLVAYFKGGAALQYCPTCPPPGRTFR